MPATLTYLGSPDQVFVLHAPRLVVGRRPPALGLDSEENRRRGVRLERRGSTVYLVVPDCALLSREHFEILRTVESGQDRYQVRDLGSSGGTYVNAAQVRHLEALRDGDRVTSWFIFRQPV